MVDLVGIEPTTSSMPWKRAPSCATGPRAKRQSGRKLLGQHDSRPGAVLSQTTGRETASLERSNRIVGSS